MKKLLVIGLAFVLLLGTIMCASAEGVSSPSENGPAVISATDGDADCTADIIVTPYSKADGEILDVMNAAKSGLTDLTDIAAKLGRNASDIAVSDFFDVHATGEHGALTITLNSSTFNGFVALLFYSNDAWNVVENASVNAEDDNYFLTFTAEGFGPYAIIVETTPSEEPVYGDVNNDTEIDMKDVLALRKYIAHMDVPVFDAENADVNADGEVDMKDVLALRKFIAHLIDHLGPAQTLR